MIINGGSRCNAAFWAAHLSRADTNERVSVTELRGVTAETLKDALYEMQWIAQGTRAKNGLYVADLNPRDDERLTPEQWAGAIDRLEAELGLTDQPRIIVEHEKEGRTHCHVVWSRIDAQTMTAISDSRTYARHEAAARWAEQEYALAATESVLVPQAERGARPERRGRRWENFRGEQTKLTPDQVKAEVTAIWQSADSGVAFKAALEESGDYLLARGDKRSFVVIDRFADDHSLSRRVPDKAKAVRERMADVDPASLPSVEEARAIMRGRMSEADGDTPPPESPQRKQGHDGGEPDAPPAVDVRAEHLPGQRAAGSERWPGPRATGLERPPGPRAAGAERTPGARAAGPERPPGSSASGQDMRAWFGRAWQTFTARAAAWAEFLVEEGRRVRDALMGDGQEPPGSHATPSRLMGSAGAYEPVSRPRKGPTTLEEWAAHATPLPSTLEEMTRIYDAYAPQEPAPEDDGAPPLLESGPDF